jgi:hypothetical protein
MIRDVDLDELERKANHILKTCPFRSITEIMVEVLSILKSYRALKKELEKVKGKPQP